MDLKNALGKFNMQAENTNFNNLLQEIKEIASKSKTSYGTDMYEHMQLTKSIPKNHT